MRQEGEVSGLRYSKWKASHTITYFHFRGVEDANPFANERSSAKKKEKKSYTIPNDCY